MQLHYIHHLRDSPIPIPRLFLHKRQYKNKEGNIKESKLGPASMNKFASSAFHGTLFILLPQMLQESMQFFKETCSLWTENKTILYVISSTHYKLIMSKELKAVLKLQGIMKQQKNK